MNDATQKGGGLDNARATSGQPRKTGKQKQPGAPPPASHVSAVPESMTPEERIRALVRLVMDHVVLPRYYERIAREASQRKDLPDVLP